MNHYKILSTNYASAKAAKCTELFHSAFSMLTIIVIISYSFCDLNDEETTKIIHKEGLTLTYRAISQQNSKFFYTEWLLKRR